MTPSAIDAYALLGDTRTAALSGTDGSIDWLCIPRFDSRPVFGALVGGPDAGRYAIRPATPWRDAGRTYRSGTTTVETTWHLDGGTATLTEGMVSDVDGTSLPSLLLVRRVAAVGRPVEMSVDVDPRYGWNRRPPRARRNGDVVFLGDGPDVMAVRTSTSAVLAPGCTTSVVVNPGRPVTFVLAAAHGGPVLVPDADTAWAALQADEASWRRWCASCAVPDGFADAVLRSLLTLRLLTHSPSGAPVAAPTTSLPEEVGGSRNWDYRYSWPRDASLGVAAFLCAGRTDEADRFLTWLLHATRLQRPRLPVMLSLHGTPVSDERTVEGWPGYAGSAPVRVGNSAASQHQLDAYGWPLDAAHLVMEATGALMPATFRALAAFADQTAACWHEPDAGLWEVRDAPRHYVHSKVMAWVALDRALRLARHRRVSGRRLAAWDTARSRVASAVRKRGYRPERGAYVRAFDADDLDAALLLLPATGFEPPSSPRVVDTVDAIATELDAGHGFIYRYAPGTDGLAGGEGAFLPCSFWLVSALAQTGRPDAARSLMERLVAHAGPLGLYGEQVDPSSGATLGNYPQALTHAALVQAAASLAATPTTG